MQADEIRLLFAYDRWATRRVLTVLDGLDSAVWTRTHVVGERGLGAILVHHLERTTVLMDLAEVLRLAGRPGEQVSTLRAALELFEQKGDVVSAAHARKLIEELSNS